MLNKTLALIFALLVIGFGGYAWFRTLQVIGGTELVSFGVVVVLVIWIFGWLFRDKSS